MRMPRRMRTATPPIVAPAMTPGDTVADSEDDVTGGVEDCDVSDIVVELVVGERVVGVGEVFRALDATEVGCDVVCAGGAAGRLGIAVGIARPMLWLSTLR